jgi:hypothetical protein
MRIRAARFLHMSLSLASARSMLVTMRSAPVDRSARASGPVVGGFSPSTPSHVPHVSQ